MQKAASAGARKDERASRIRHVEKESARRPRDYYLMMRSRQMASAVGGLVW
jgi:hypothetical protein